MNDLSELVGHGLPFAGDVDGNQKIDYNHASERYILVRPGGQHFSGEPEMYAGHPHPGRDSLKVLKPEDRLSLALFLYFVRIIAGLSQELAGVGARVVVEKRAGTANHFYALEIGPLSAMEETGLYDSEEFQTILDKFEDWIYVYGNYDFEDGALSHSSTKWPLPPPLRITYRVLGQCQWQISDLISQEQSKPFVFQAVTHARRVPGIRARLAGLRKAILFYVPATTVDDLTQKYTDIMYAEILDDENYLELKDAYICEMERFNRLLFPKGKMLTQLSHALKCVREKKSRSHHAITKFFQVQKNNMTKAVGNTKQGQRKISA